ncbi:MAG: DUF3829 domain-containing protein, partial [Myxococcales bacterium]|nr:DUF3829 domain-containing protein [Myxococcales bacterium]
MSRPRALAPGLLALALSPLCAGACTWFDSVDDDGGEQDQDQDKDAVEQAEQVDAKLRAYSACRDAVAWQVSQTWLRYVDQVDEHGQPRHKREGVYIHGIGRNAFRGCRRTLASAPRTPPNMPTLQAHTEATVDAAERFAELTRDLEHALDSDDRDPADWSTLARLDPDLRQQFATWRSADALLEDAVDARHLSNDPLLLGVLEGRRSPLEVASRALMLESRPVARCLVREPAP